VSGGVINRTISRTDPRVAFLFGDGAAAVLLVPSRTRHVLASYSFSNYDFVEQARGFEVRRVLSVDFSDAVEHRKMYELYSQEDYKRALEFVLEAMRVTVRALLQRAGRQLSDVDVFLVTENHGRMWSAIIEHLGIEAQKTLSLLAKYGNTMSAMLPLLLDEAIRSGRLQPGSLVMLLSVGEGVSGGGMLISI
jgi:3-oxoacyl-[acyl-carrier-protein] synthase-3